MTRAGRDQAAGRVAGTWAPLTSFLGRAEATAELIRLVDGGRLVTVTGPGGVGKTRLATEVARRVADRFPDGAWFIGLGSVTDPARVPAEVLSALGARQDAARPPLEALAEALAPCRLLPDHRGARPAARRPRALLPRQSVPGQGHGAARGLVVELRRPA